MTTFDTFSTPSEITHPRHRKLCRRVDGCLPADDAVRVIRRIAATAHAEAVEILAALLDDRGPPALAAVEGLLTFGRAAIPEMQRVVREAPDEDAVRHAHMVLARLGHTRSMRALADEHWVVGTGPASTAGWLVGCGVRGVFVLLEHWVEEDVAATFIAHREPTEELLFHIAVRATRGLDVGALHVLGKMRCERALPLLKALLGSSDEALRSVAIEGYAALRGRAVVPMLVHTALDPTEPERVRDTCIEALGALALAA